MNEQEQRIAIAEFCGWSDFYSAEHEGATLYGRRPLSCSNSWELPYYLNDLNAIHEVWEKLSFPQKADFAVILNRLMGLEGNISGWVSLIGATAAQRSEALLRTVGLWKD